MPEIGAATRFTFTISGVSSTTWVARFEAVEAISELFEVHLDLASDDKDIAFADVVGKPALLKLETDGSEPRFLHGIVSRFRHSEDGKKLTVYHATLVPKLWRLRLRHDSRIFQAMTVPAIIEQVLDGAGITDRRLALSGSYAPREYCVQYRESDLAFVSRLMEEEGVYYFFEHSEDKHVLVLADAPSATAPIASPDSIAYKGPLGAMAHGESISRFSSAEEVRTGKVTLTDFNFKKPALSLTGSSAASHDPDLELYDYPGEYEMPGDGSALSKVRLEEQQARRAVVDGECGVIRLLPGFKLTLTDHPRDADNREYLLTQVRQRGVQPIMMDSGSGESPSYGNSFTAIPADVPFRPERRTPRPTIKGVQTAIVTGPGGDEIHTDEHGRVKVHFHWDRLGKKDDKSSCWIRVSQLWAGAGWGAMWIPRIGHEVIVDFIEGDPDRPIIVGRVYHGANVPPYPLPGEKTKSTIKSDSSPGHGGSNELRFEDKKGSEEIYLHAQKDWNTKVEHDRTQIVGHDEALHVGHDRSKHVGHDQSEQVDRDKSIKVGRDHNEKIGRDESVTIAANAKRQVGADQAVSVGGNSTLGVDGDLTENVGGDMSTAIGGDLTVSAAGSKTESVGGDSGETVGKGKDVTVGKNLSFTVAGNMSADVAKNLTENVSGEAALTVGKKLTMTVGSGSVTIEKNGNITIVGKDITIKGDGKINVQGGSKVVVKSDGPVDVEASGAVKIKGSAIDLN